MSNSDNPTISFANDISPFFAEFRANMIWRFDLTNYDDVKANAEIILSRISGKTMPPPPFSPLSDEFIESFQQWMKQGYQP